MQSYEKSLLVQIVQKKECQADSLALFLIDRMKMFTSPPRKRL